jgi:NlpC/P60 family putative phage cell wall peptidase
MARLIDLTVIGVSPPGGEAKMGDTNKHTRKAPVDRRSATGCDGSLLPNPARVIAAARDWLGTPYHDQASVKGVGCDCLGLVRGVWREVVGDEPLPLPRYSRDWGETGNCEPLAEAARSVMLELPVADVVPGALILFRMRAGAVAKHCGIVTAPDHFVHAYERTGVIEEPLTAAWRRRIAFGFLFAGDEGRSMSEG